MEALIEELASLSSTLAAPGAMFVGTSLLFLMCKKPRRKKDLKLKSQRKAVSFHPELVSSVNSYKDPNHLTKQEVAQLRSKHFCNAVSLSYANSGPLMIVEGTGSRLMDETGRWYLDTRNNVAHVGHCNSKVVQAVQKQVATLNTNTRYLHPNVCLLAQRLSDLLPTSLEKVFFVNSGSEANDLALRLARAYTGSKNTIVVSGGYHGHTLGCLEVSPYKYEHSQEFQLAPPASGTDFKTPAKHIWKVPCPNMYRGLLCCEDSATNASAAKYAEYVEEACQFYKEKRGEKVGAFLVEGGMSVAGVIIPPPGYMQKSVQAVRDAGGVYIADEVQTGFGRLGTSVWAFQQHSGEVVPDIVTVGKPFGNGMALGAVVTTREIAEKFEAMGVEYFNTFGGNPVCAAAGLAVLDIMESENLQQHAAEVGQYLKDKLNELQKTTLNIIGDVRGSGLFLGIELVRDQSTKEPATAETSFLCTILKAKYSILTSIDGPDNNVLVVKPPMVFSTADADIFLDSFEKAVCNDLLSIEQQDLSSIPITPT